MEVINVKCSDQRKLILRANSGLPPPLLLAGYIVTIQVQVHSPKSKVQSAKSKGLEVTLFCCANQDQDKLI